MQMMRANDLIGQKGDTIKIAMKTSLGDVKKIGEHCDKCGKCCSYGSGFVLESEVPRIAAFLNTPKDKFIKNFLEETEIFHTKVFKFRQNKQTNKNQTSKPYGPCMFLENKLCKIQQVKPLHCTIGNCKEHGDDLNTWFLLNYCLNIYDPESIRQYHSYVKTGGKVLEGAELNTLFPDKAKLRQILSYERFK